MLRELAANEPRIRAVFHDRNQGKGGAIRTAIRHMTGDIAIIQDADLEYDPAEIARVIRPILDGRADAVFGSRFLSSEYRRVLYFWHTLGNGVLTWFCNLLCDINLTDMETCYKAVRADILRQIPLQFREFAFEPELTDAARAVGHPPLRGARSATPAGPTSRVRRSAGRDGFRALWAMFRCLFLDTRFTTHDGYYILVAVRNARAFNRWMYRQIAPYVGKHVLEAGCGIGNLTELLARQRPAGGHRLRPVLRRDDRAAGSATSRTSGTLRMDLTRAEDYGRLARRVASTRSSA